MCWCPGGREREFYFIMVKGHSCPNSQLCVSPLLKWCTWLPWIHCLVKSIAPQTKQVRNEFRKVKFLHNIIGIFTSKGCLRISLSSSRSSTLMNKFLFRLKLTVVGYTYRQWKSCKKGSFLVVVRKSKAWNWKLNKTVTLVYIMHEYKTFKT